MTNYNERLDEALRNHRGRVLTYHELFRKQHNRQLRLNADLAHADAVAKQAFTSLIKELVAESRPEPTKYEKYNSDCLEGFNIAADEFEQNLLKALEEV